VRGVPSRGPGGVPGCLKRSVLVLAATAWTTTAIPAVFGASYLALGLKDRSPDLCLALILQAVASPMMAAPALAALMGLDSTLVLVALITSTAVIPFSAPAFTYAFIGDGLTLSPLALGVRLFAILAVRRSSASPSPDGRPRRHRAARRRNQRGEHSGPLRLRGGRHGKRRGALSCCTGAHRRVRRACLPRVFRGVWPDQPPLCPCGAGARVCPRAHGVAAQHGADARGDGRGLARPHVALFALSQFPIYLSPQLLRPLARRLVSPSRIAPRPRGPLDSGGEDAGARLPAPTSHSGLPGPDPARSASLFPLQDVLPYLGQGQLGRTILDEAHGVRPALLQAVGACGVGQGDLDDVVLGFVPCGTAGEGQAEVGACERAHALGQTPGRRLAEDCRVPKLPAGTPGRTVPIAGAVRVTPSFKNRSLPASPFSVWMIELP